MEKKQKWTIKSILKEIVIGVLILFVMSNVISYLRAPALESRFLPPLRATLLDGTKITPQTYKDKPLLIYFWATWCPICKIQSPNMESLSKDYHLLCIATQSGDEDEIKAYMHEHDVNFAVLNDTYGDLAQQFKVSVYPTTFIYDTNGKLRFTEVGYTSLLGLYARMWWVK